MKSRKALKFSKTMIEDMVSAFIALRKPFQQDNFAHKMRPDKSQRKSWNRHQQIPITFVDYLVQSGQLSQLALVKAKGVKSEVRTINWFKDLISQNVS